MLPTRTPWFFAGADTGKFRSPAYSAYAHALEILQGVAHSVELNRLDPRHSRSRPQSTQHPTSVANRSSRVGPYSIASASTNSNCPATQPFQKSKNGQDVQPVITLSDLPAKRRVRKVECTAQHHLALAAVRRLCLKFGAISIQLVLRGTGIFHPSSLNAPGASWTSLMRHLMSSISSRTAANTIPNKEGILCCHGPDYI
jgi:hypothetical protein